MITNFVILFETDSSTTAPQQTTISIATSSSLPLQPEMLSTTLLTSKALLTTTTKLSTTNTVATTTITTTSSTVTTAEIPVKKHDGRISSDTKQDLPLQPTSGAKSTFCIFTLKILVFAILFCN